MNVGSDGTTVLVGDCQIFGQGSLTGLKIQMREMGLISCMSLCATVLTVTEFDAILTLLKEPYRTMAIDAQ